MSAMHKKSSVLQGANARSSPWGRETPPRHMISVFPEIHFCKYACLCSKSSTNCIAELLPSSLFKRVTSCTITFHLLCKNGLFYKKCQTCAKTRCILLLAEVIFLSNFNCFNSGNCNSNAVFSSFNSFQLKIDFSVATVCNILNGCKFCFITN